MKLGVVDLAGSTGICAHLPGSGVRITQARMPSLHVCSNLASPGRPHLPRQDPPLPQQVSCPLLSYPHVPHPEQQIVVECDKIFEVGRV